MDIKTIVTLLMNISNKSHLDDEKQAIAEAIIIVNNKVCTGCNGHGLVGNIFDTNPCPFCKGTGIESDL